MVCLVSRTGRQFQRYNKGRRQVVGYVHLYIWPPPPEEHKKKNNYFWIFFSEFLNMENLADVFRTDSSYQAMEKLVTR